MKIMPMHGSNILFSPHINDFIITLAFHYHSSLVRVKFTGITGGDRFTVAKQRGGGGEWQWNILFSYYIFLILLDTFHLKVFEIRLDHSLLVPYWEKSTHN